MDVKFALLLLVACSAHAAMVRRDAPPSALEHVQKNAEEFAKTFSEQINSLVNSKNSQDFQKALKDSQSSVLEHVSALSNSLQSVMKDADGKAKEALQKARTELEKTTTELKEKHPEVEQQAGALKDQLQNAVQTTLTHSQNLAKEVAANIEKTNEELAPKIKSAYDNFVQQMQELQKKLHEAATKQ